MRYLRERREALGGYLPLGAHLKRLTIKAPPLKRLTNLCGSRGREASTTMPPLFGILKALLKLPELSKIHCSDYSG